MWKLGLSDMVTFNGDVWYITKLTKTQYTAQKFNSDGENKSDFIRITINSGKVAGQSSWANLLEGTPEEFYAKIQAKIDEKKAAADRRAQEWQVKVAAVRAANSNIVVTDEHLGLSKAIMINEKDERMIVYFTAQETDYWKIFSDPIVKGVRIDAHTWCKDWGERYGFSSTQANGLTIEDALIELVAGHYWN
jgi:hypothetical protein